LAYRSGYGAGGDGDGRAAAGVSDGVGVECGWVGAGALDGFAGVEDVVCAGRVVCEIADGDGEMELYVGDGLGAGGVQIGFDCCLYCLADLGVDVFGQCGESVEGELEEGFW